MARRRGAGPAAGSWRRSPAWTTYVPLDHLNAVGPPGSRNTVVQRNVSGPTAFKWSKQIDHVTTCETPSHHARRPAGRGAGTASGVARAARLPGPDDPSEPDRPRRPAPADPTAPAPPTHPEATRADHHGRPPCPTALNDPSHHTRQTHSDAPNNLPDEEESFERDVSDLHARFTPSKPPLNNLQGNGAGGVRDGRGGAPAQPYRTGLRRMTGGSSSRRGLTYVFGPVRAPQCRASTPSARCPATSVPMTWPRATVSPAPTTASTGS